MRYRFFLLPAYLDTLRCIEYDDVIGDKRVKRVRIFSPEQARQHNLCIRGYEDMEKHPEMLLYDGYTDTDGTVYIGDRRTPIRVRAGQGTA